MNASIDHPGIYAIRCYADGQGTTYIGQAGKTIARRFAEHRKRLRGGKHPNTHLQRAWNLYGEAGFEFYALENVFAKDELTRMEQYWLDHTRLTVPVYNFGESAHNPMLGQTHTEAARAKLSAAHTGRQKSPSHIRNIASALRGHPVSDETKQAVSRAALARPSDSPITRWLKGAFRGKKFSDEHKQRLSDSQAQPYPAFVNGAGEVIPAGVGLAQMCKARDLDVSKMSAVIHGRRSHHKGWYLK